MNRATYRVKIDGRWHTVTGFAAASRLVQEMRDASGQGSRDWYSYQGQGLILNGNNLPIARVSYNGKVWEPRADDPCLIMEAAGKVEL